MIKLVVIAVLVDSAMCSLLSDSLILVASARGHRDPDYGKKVFDDAITSAPKQFRAFSEIYVSLTHQLATHTAVMQGFVKCIIDLLNSSTKPKLKQIAFEPEQKAFLMTVKNLNCEIDENIAKIAEAATSSESWQCLLNLADDFMKKRNAFLEEVSSMRLDRSDTSMDTLTLYYTGMMKSRARLFRTSQEMITDAGRFWVVSDTRWLRSSLARAHRQINLSLVAVSSAIRQGHSQPSTFINAILVNTVLLGEMIRAACAVELNDASAAWTETQAEMIPLQGDLAEYATKRGSGEFSVSFLKHAVASARLFLNFERLL